MSDPSLWTSINDVRDRLARHEERSNNRDVKISEMTGDMEQMNNKLDKLISMVNQAQGAGKTAMLFGKWGYGLAGLTGATIIANWQAVKKLF